MASLHVGSLRPSLYAALGKCEDAELCGSQESPEGPVGPVVDFMLC